MLSISFQNVCSIWFYLKASAAAAVPLFFGAWWLWSSEAWLGFFGQFRVVLGWSWAGFRVVLSDLVVVLGGLGTFLGRLGSILGRLWALLERSEANMWIFVGFTRGWDPPRTGRHHPRGC